MVATPSYDLAPLAPIALFGLLLASAPALWLWLRHRGATSPARRRALTALTLFFCFDLVLFGAYTRLSDSGLGCPDWPGCYGSASPLGADAHIDAAEAHQPSGPVTARKAWVEMVHRYLATGVGALITLLAVLQALAWRRERTRAHAAAAAWALATFGWVCVQGAFGALTVTWKLYPAIVTAHLLGGVVLLALLAAQIEQAEPRPLALPAALRQGVVGVSVLVLVQIALGGWVSTNYAVLACQDFPTCQGAWWPPMDFAHAFAVQRELGQGKDGGALPFAALTAIHVAHRAFALVVFAALGMLAWRLARIEAARRFGVVVAGLALWQFASGLSNVVLGWPLVAALAHTGGAAALVVVLTRLIVRQTQACVLPAAVQEAPAKRQLHHV